MDDIFVLELFRNTFVRTWLNLVQRVLSELLIAVGSVPLKWGLPRFSLSLSVFLSFSTICLLEHVFENTYRETLVSTCLFAFLHPPVAFTWRHNDVKPTSKTHQENNSDI